MLRYLLDEHIHHAYRLQLLRLDESLAVRKVGEPDAPPLGTLDPDLLIWCEENGFVLVTNNRKSMPRHITEHLANGRHIPGIFVINLERSISENSEALYLVAATSTSDEYRDRITYIPFW